VNVEEEEEEEEEVGERVVEALPAGDAGEGVMDSWDV